MEFIDTVNNRHSIRDFKSQPIAEEELEKIVETAGKAPSWANVQPWKVVIATGESLEKVRSYHESGRTEHSEFPSLHRGSMGKQGQANLRTWSSGINNFLGADANDMYTDSEKLFNAPAVAYLLLPRNINPWTIYDLGAFGQTLMLAAKDRGIDSIPAEEFVFNPSYLHQVLGVSDDYLFAVGIGLGYPKDAKINQFRSERMSLDQYLTIKD